MSTKNILAFGGAALALVGGLSYLTRQAEIRDVTVTEGRSSIAPSIRVALHYGSGTRPWSVIIDVVAANGISGSYTVDGDEEVIEVPLSAPLNSSYSIATTATYRLLGTPRVVKRTYVDFR